MGWRKRVSWNDLRLCVDVREDLIDGVDQAGDRRSRRKINNWVVRIRKDVSHDGNVRRRNIDNRVSVCMCRPVVLQIELLESLLDCQVRFESARRQPLRRIRTIMETDEGNTPTGCQFLRDV